MMESRDLHRFLRRGDFRQRFESVARAMAASWAVQDSAGRDVIGESSPTDPREPVTVDGQRIGSVSAPGGGATARVLAAALAALAGQERDKKRVASEVLHGYEILGALRELAASLSVMADGCQASAQALGTLVLLTRAQGGCVAALSRARQLRLLACIGDSDQATRLLVHNSPFVIQTLRTGKGELVTDTRHDERIGHDGFLSLMCAPLTWGGSHNGLVLLGSAESGAFTANDFDMLRHVALLTAAAVAHARNVRMLCTTNDVLDNLQPVLTS